MFEHYRTFSYNLAGRDLTIETGKMAQLSNGSCLVRYGDTVVLAQRRPCAKKPRDGIDFFPLSVDFEEKPLRGRPRCPAAFCKPRGPSERKGHPDLRA